MGRVEVTRIAGVLVAMGLFVSSCSGEGADAEVTEEPSGCSVEVVALQFADDAPVDEVNRVHAATSDVGGVRTVKRAEGLGEAPLIEATIVDGVGASELTDLAAASDAVVGTERSCAED